MAVENGPKWDIWYFLLVVVLKHWHSSSEKSNCMPSFIVLDVLVWSYSKLNA